VGVDNVWEWLFKTLKVYRANIALYFSFLSDLTPGED